MEELFSESQAAKSKGGHISSIVNRKRQTSSGSKMAEQAASYLKVFSLEAEDRQSLR